MRFATALAASVWMVMAPAAAWAQEEDDDTVAEAAAPSEAEESDDVEGEGDANRPSPTLSASGYATTEQPFEPRRGFSVEGQFGIFTTIGGRNANNQQEGFPTVGLSNANPYLTLVFGYDVYSTRSFSLKIGPKIGASFNGGSARLGDEELQADAAGTLDASTFANDYAAYEAGIDVAFLISVTERLAVTVKLNGGAVFVDPNPNVDFCGADSSSTSPSPTLPPQQPDQNERQNFRDACGNTDAGDLAIGGLFGASAGVELYTLLNGFSVGLEIRFQGLLVDGFIPSLAFVPGVIRYTF